MNLLIEDAKTFQAPPVQPYDEWAEARETLRIHEENDKLYGALVVPEVFA